MKSQMVKNVDTKIQKDLIITKDKEKQQILSLQSLELENVGYLRN